VGNWQRIILQCSPLARRKVHLEALHTVTHQSSANFVTTLQRHDVVTLSAATALWHTFAIACLRNTVPLPYAAATFVNPDDKKPLVGRVNTSTTLPFCATNDALPALLSACATTPPRIHRHAHQPLPLSHSEETHQQERGCGGLALTMGWTELVS
jgi:hypothetical protein